MTTVCCFVINRVLYVHTLQTMHLPLSLPSHLFFHIPKRTNKQTENKQTKKKQPEQVTKKKQVKAEMEPSKKKTTAKQDRNDTTILSQHSYILCHFAKYICTVQNSLHTH